MKIVTLNVNGFRGNVKKNDYVSNSELISNLNNLKFYIDNLCIDDESIVVLQEIPHKMLIDKSVSPWIWKELEMFRMFKTLFEKNYKVFYPRFLIDSEQCTVALAHKNTKWNYTSKNIIKYNRWHHYGNKLIEIEKNNDTLLGVHVSPCEEMWNILLSSLEENEVTFIVGDFNAYEKRGIMNEKPMQLRNLGYSPLISSSVITNFIYESSIDNLYINSECKLTNGIHIDVKRTDDFFTDHAACMFEFYEKDRQNKNH